MFSIACDYLLKLSTSFYHFSTWKNSLQFTMFLWVFCEAIFFYWISKKTIMQFMHNSLFLIILEEHRSTCPEGKTYRFYRKSVLSPEVHSLGRKICRIRGRNVKMSWQYTCHCIQRETENNYHLNKLETSDYHFIMKRKYFCQFLINMLSVYFHAFPSMYCAQRV